MIRIKIRGWLQFLLHKKIGRDTDGHLFHTIDPAPIYNVQHTGEADVALLCANMPASLRAQQLPVDYTLQ